MKSMEQADLFTDNPIAAFKNAGNFEYRKKWSWVGNDRYHALYCITKGTYRVTLRGQEYLLGVEDVLYTRGEDTVLMQVDGTEPCAHSFISFYCREDFDLGIHSVLHAPGIASLFVEIEKAWHSAAPLYRLKTGYLFTSLLYTLAKRSLSMDTSPEIERLRRATEYIHINCTERVTTEQLCRIAGYSGAHLRRLFLQHYGASPSEYMINVRIERAKELLTELPARSVEEIAQSLGFSSCSYFCKQFREKVGQTPLAFRNRKKD